MEEQVKHGTVDIQCGGDTPTEMLASVSGGSDTDLAQRSTSPLELVHPKVLNLCAIVGTVGAVSAMHLFIWLCFQKPDAANVLIPLLIMPFAGFVMRRAVKRK